MKEIWDRLLQRNHNTLYLKPRINNLFTNQHAAARLLSASCSQNQTGAQSLELCTVEVLLGSWGSVLFGFVLAVTSGVTASCALERDFEPNLRWLYPRRHAPLSTVNLWRRSSIVAKYKVNPLFCTIVDQTFDVLSNRTKYHVPEKPISYLWKCKLGSFMFVFECVGTTGIIHLYFCSSILCQMCWAYWSFWHIFRQQSNWMDYHLKPKLRRAVPPHIWRK
jgi:hypothetical protein